MRGRCRRLVVLLVVGGSLIGCSSGSGGSTSRAGDLEPLHRRAVAHGYQSQARILEDGKVTLDEYTEAGQALIDCARRRGLPMRLYRVRDMFGTTISTEPTVVAPNEGARATRVTEACQEREQMLVEMGWGKGRPPISDEAYDLWRECLATAGFQGDVPRSYSQIIREIDPELAGPCDRTVTAGLLELGTP